VQDHSRRERALEMEVARLREAGRRAPAPVKDEAK
jgi:hypothetical protein